MMIVIEGCVGAGKSTIATALALLRNSNVLLEDFEANPFLRAFYKDPFANAMETEFAFLLLHFHQLKTQVRLASPAEIVADFHLGKDLLYADLNLSDSRVKPLFVELYNICREKTPQPDLMICLSASTDLLVERIRRRKREFETSINHEYLDAVNMAYEELFAQYRGRKLRLRMDEWDFVKEPYLLNGLSSMIDEVLGQL
jgi:deoxyguanosine kinase